MSSVELSKQDYPIDSTYKEVMAFEELFEGDDEDLDAYYARMHRVTKEILKKHDPEGGRVVCEVAFLMWFDG